MENVIEELIKNLENILNKCKAAYVIIVKILLIFRQTCIQM